MNNDVFLILGIAVGMLVLVGSGYHLGYEACKDKLYKQFTDDLKKINKFKKSLGG